MKNKHWQKLEQLFHQAHELAIDEVEDFLNKECKDDSKLKKEVLDLLKAQHSSDVHLTAQVANTSKQMLGDLAIGTVIGAYRIIDKLGQGGMGAVYLAERVNADFEQQVAIKLISSLQNNDEIAKRFIERFIAERKILAQLKHPNIAHLIGGGSTEAGQPYFAMEYIKGVDIIQYCDNQHLNIKQRIEKFIAVCAAVGYAHRQLILHRDIKPSNILVDQDGQPKLLDFGIAKLINQDGTNNTKNSITVSQLMMTPEYASPEQILGQPVGVATDIYQLGLVLYQLLTGHATQQVTDAYFLEAKEIIVENLPSSPSVKVLSGKRQDTISGNNIAKNRGTHQEKLADKLKGDLDTIVLKCLNKNPEHRYQTVNDLINDLDAYLNLRPIKAKGLSKAYRLNRFVRRHWAGVAASSFAIIALVLGLAFSLISLEKTKAAEQRAETQAQTANQVAAFLVDIITDADPRESDGQEVTVKQVLTKSVTKIDNLKQQPLIQARLLNIIGKAYIGLGQVDQSSQLLERAVSLAQTHVKIDKTIQIEALTLLSASYQAQEKFKEALALIKTAAMIARKSKQLLAETLAAHSGALYNFEQVEESFSIGNEALVLMQTSTQPVDVITQVKLMGLIGIIHLQKNQFKPSEKILKQALKIAEEQEDSLAMQQTINLYLGILYNVTGEFKKSEKHQIKSVEMGQKIYGKNHNEVAMALIGLAKVQMQLTKLPQAEGSISEALRISEIVSGKEHGSYVLAYNIYANLKYAQGHYKTSLEMFNEYLNNHNKNTDENFIEYLVIENYSLQPLIALGRYQEVITLAEESLLIIKGKLGEEHFLNLKFKAPLAQAKLATGDYKQAEVLAKQLINSQPENFVLIGIETVFNINYIKKNLEICQQQLTKYNQILRLRQTENRVIESDETKYLQLLAKFKTTNNKNAE